MCETIIIAAVGWIITIAIAVYTVKSSAKDTDKKLESIKKLARIQIKTSQIQINKELWEARIKSLKANERSVEMSSPLSNNIVSGFDSYYHRQDKKRDLEHEYDYERKHAHALEEYQKALNELSKEMEG